MEQQAVGESLLYWPRVRQRDESAANGAFSMKRLYSSYALLARARRRGLRRHLDGDRSSSDDVAVVGSQAITKDEFQALMDRAKKSYDAQKKPFPKPGTTEYEQLKGQAVTYLIQQAEFEQEADAMGIKITDDQVEQVPREAEEAVLRRQRVALPEGAQAAGTDRGAGQGRDVHAQLISEELFKKVTTDVTVSQAEVKAYYNSHKSQYGQPETRDVRHILVPKKALADSASTRS